MNGIYAVGVFCLFESNLTIGTDYLTMILQVDFKHTLIGDSDSEEKACLGIFSERIVAILVCSSEIDNDPEHTQWYLDKGFGSCDQQGLMFSSLDSAKNWIISQLNKNDNWD
ncbi:hypothetical protein [Methylobacterium sp. 88A]|uniref:hypothetical protein n=1 Tax=Methylobacterium sp. 88A TaxID=1131813 RepID=UPI0012F673EE|nr:hypothetical protein [Methylobacterium sp. 88A]